MFVLRIPFRHVFEGRLRDLRRDLLEEFFAGDAPLPGFRIDHAPPNEITNRVLHQFVLPIFRLALEFLDELVLHVFLDLFEGDRLVVDDGGDGALRIGRGSGVGWRGVDRARFETERATGDERQQAECGERGQQESGTGSGSGGVGVFHHPGESMRSVRVCPVLVAPQEFLREAGIVSGEDGGPGIGHQALIEAHVVDRTEDG